MNDADTVGDGDGTDDPILETLATADRSPLSVREVTTRLGWTRGRARVQLQRLANDGCVERFDAEHLAWWSLPGRTSERAPDAPDSSGDEIVATDLDPTADDAGENRWTGLE